MPQELTVLIHIYCAIREQPEVENLRIQPYWETILSFSQRSLLHFYSIGLGSFSPCVSAEQLQHGKTNLLHTAIYQLFNEVFSRVTSIQK